MAWVRYDDGFHDHDKVALLRVDHPEALALHLLANTWTSRTSTPGYVPAAIPAVLVGKTKARRWAPQLVAAGLWEDVDGGWAFVNHARYRAPEGRQTPGTPEELSAKRAAAGRRGGASTAAKRAANTATADSNSKQVPSKPCSPVPEPVPEPAVGLTESPPPPSVPREHGEEEHPAATVRAARSAAGLAVDGWTDQACQAAVFAVKDAAQQRHAGQAEAWAALTVVARMPDTSHPGRLVHKLHDALDEVDRMRRDAGNARADAAVLTELAAARERAVDPTEVPAWREARELLAARAKRASA